jgi:hypothetical protein
MLRKMFVGMILFLIMEGLAPVSVYAGDEDRSDGRPARVNVDTLNLRAGAGTEYAIVRSLTRGSLLGVLEEQGEWSRVRAEDGTVGWVATKFIAPVVPWGTVGGSTTDQPSAGGAVGATGAAPSIGSRDGQGSGSKAGALVKWGCLAGGLVAGGLWYSAHSDGNDAYEEYKRLYGDGEYDAAEAKYRDAADHDDKAQVYAIAGGVLVGLFVLQQFVLGGDHHNPDRLNSLCKPCR